MISNIPSVRTTVEALLAKGVRHVILSPGSRNAPFALSFSAISDFECHSVLDERTAGFVALGIAQQTHVPVVLCCTSGSAMLNYAPALSEAYYQHIPIIILTADRPDEWIDQGEGQSLRQRNLLDGITLKSFHLAQGATSVDDWYNQRQVSEAVSTATGIVKGPIHINVPLREPLYELSERAPLSFQSFKVLQPRRRLHAEDMIPLASVWANTPSILILVGQGNHPDGLQEQLVALNNDARVAILTETTANVQHLGFVSCIDRTIETFHSGEEAINYVPELLITLGENIVSKKLKAMFRRGRSKIKNHWHLGDKAMDTFQSLTHVLPVQSEAFLRGLAEIEPTETNADFGVQWRSRFFLNEQLHLDFLASASFSDLKAFELILDFVPDAAQVQMGNSSVIRYIQLFNPMRSVRYFGNRGVSGIEGCMSTAVGAAMASEELVLHISGDHAFRYDSNALGAARPKNLRVIVINNAGGNIFRIIPGPTRHAASDKFIEATNGQSIQKLVEYHEAEYLKATDLQSLETALIDLMSPERDSCAVLEVFTPREASPEILAAYFERMKG